MDRLTSDQVVVMFLSLGILLGAARLLGEVAKRWGLPSVVGEILSGILLGPTLFGALAPQWSSAIFPAHGPNAIALDGLTTLAITLFLLVAGMEIDLSAVWRQGKVALTVGVTSVVFPFALGFAAAWFAPSVLRPEPGVDRLVFSLFIATALSITALPIIVKILMDLNLYRSDLGMVIVAAAAIGDLAGWIVFALILGMMERTPGGERVNIVRVIALTFGFAVAMLTVVRHLIHRAIPWIQAHASWPGGVLGFALVLGMFGAAFSEWMGVHAIFGSFLAGIAIGDSPHLREQTRSIIDRFVSFIFAPLFFAGIGLRVNFIQHLDIILVLVMLVLAVSGKLSGCVLGARWGGLSWKESLATGSGMLSQGSMGIILGLLAMQNGVIGDRIFVAIVLVSLLTSLMSGPLIQRALRRPRACSFTDYLTAGTFIHRLGAGTWKEAVKELCGIASLSSGLDEKAVEAEVLARELTMPTGLGNGVAVPHARIRGLARPVVCLGLSSDGIDFDAPDGEPAQIVLLILSPIDDDCANLEIFADIARVFANKEARLKALHAGSYTEFLAIVKAHGEHLVMPDTINHPVPKE